MLWSALAIPVLTLLALYFIFHHTLVWWEPLLCFAVCPIIIGICSAINWAYQTGDLEWCTDQVVRIEYHEAYTERWTEIQTTTDSKGKMRTKIVHRVRHNPEMWYKCTNSWDASISEKEYNRIRNHWAPEATPIYKDLYHSRQALDGGRGDMYYVNWPNIDKKIEAVTWTQRYENRIQASHSVLKFRELSKEEKVGLYELPKPDWDHNCDSIIGDGGPTYHAGNKRLTQWNAKVGPRPWNHYKVACRIWIVVFKDQPLQKALDQENYWYGGNKNEFILCVGVDKDYKVKWSHVISWTKNERLKIQAKDAVKIGQQLDLVDAADTVGILCYNSYLRRSFKEFNYLHIEPTPTMIWVTWILTFIVNLGVCVFVVLNPFTNSDPYGDNCGRYSNTSRFKVLSDWRTRLPRMDGFSLRLSRTKDKWKR